MSENTVAALMAALCLAARRRKRRRATTRPGRARWRAPDLVQRDFRAGQVNARWYGDGTEIGTDEGNLHLASILDMALAGCWALPSASTMTPLWPTVLWPWPSRSAAAAYRA